MQHILIISGSVLLSELVQCVLRRRLPGVEIVCAGDRRSAIVLNAGRLPRVILLDMSEPSRVDRALIAELKSRNHKASLLVLSYPEYREYVDAAVASQLDGYFDIASETFVDDLHREVVRILQPGAGAGLQSLN